MAHAIKAGHIAVRTSGEEGPESGCLLSYEPQKASGFAAELGLEAETPALCDAPWDPEERYRGGVAAYTKIMTFAPPEQPAAYYDAGIKNFVFGEMWERPGLDQRARRWITLSCVGASDTPNPILTHVYAAMNAGDATLEEMHEFVLQFGFEVGWPKASVMIAAVFDAAAKLEQGKGWM